MVMFLHTIILYLQIIMTMYTILINNQWSDSVKKWMLSACLFAVISFVLCACAGDHQSSSPSGDYEQVSLDGLDLPCYVISVVDKVPMLREQNGVSIRYHEGKLLLCTADSLKEESMREGILEGVVQSYSQYIACGYEAVYFMRYREEAFYLAAEKNGVLYVLPCVERGGDGRGDLAIFDEPLSMNEFFCRIERFQRSPGAESLSGGYGFDTTK